MRTLRRWLSIGLPILGMVLVFAAVIAIVDRQYQLGLVILGVLLIEAGVWKLANPFLPSERKYTELRTEVDRFIGLVRELNSAALEARQQNGAEQWDRYRQVLATLHDSVDRMGELAGKELGEEETDARRFGEVPPMRPGEAPSSNRPFGRPHDPLA